MKWLSRNFILLFSICKHVHIAQNCTLWLLVELMFMHISVSAKDEVVGQMKSAQVGSPSSKLI
uniref:Uncharacterized protein n=1 Tax=Arundo donax TaxID=35708 RepID=A0A0A9DPN0_ARUDO